MAEIFVGLDYRGDFFPIFLAGGCPAAHIQFANPKLSPDPRALLSVDGRAIFFASTTDRGVALTR